MTIIEKISRFCIAMVLFSSFTKALMGMEDQLEIVDAFRSLNLSSQSASADRASCPECLTFLTHFFCDKRIGSLWPSSECLAVAITACIESWDLEAYPEGRNILEVGPGTGVFTEQIIRKMGPRDTLHLVELDETFCRILVEKFGRDPRVKIYNCSITEFHTKIRFHYLISGLPFNIFPAELVANILRCYKNLLMPFGTCAYFEYLWLPMIKMCALQACSCCFRSMLKKKNDYSRTLKQLEAFKRSFETVQKTTVLRNFPSARVFTCRHIQHID